MFKRYISSLTVVLVGFFALAQASLGGSWNGTIEIPSNPLEIAVTFEEGAQLSGTIDIPAQGAIDLALVDVTHNGAEVSFGIEGVPGNPSFEGSLQEGVISGEYSQSGQTFPFELTPGGANSVNRPQEPTPPYPYTEEQVTVQTQTEQVSLAGTLTLPEGDGPFTAVLMLTGSGPQDRDETLMGHKPFWVLADTLARAGYASLRLDDRGVGGSSGDLSQATFADLTQDAVAATRFLKDRQDIREFGVLGHSEGGYIAPLVANEDADVAFAIMLAGPAVSGEEVLIEQNRKIFSQAGTPEQAESQVRYLKELVSLLQEEKYAQARDLVEEQVSAQFAALPENQRPDEASQQQAVQAQVENTISPYMRSFIIYNPDAALRALRVPVLAIYGGKDIQVAADQSAPVLEGLLQDNADVTIKTYPNLNHLLQPAQTGGVEEYGEIETTLAPVVLEALTSWLEKRF